MTPGNCMTCMQSSQTIQLPVTMQVKGTALYYRTPAMHRFSAHTMIIVWRSSSHMSQSIS
jgi:hypothetical protein